MTDPRALLRRLQQQTQAGRYAQLLREGTRRSFQQQVLRLSASEEAALRQAAKL